MPPVSAAPSPAPLAEVRATDYHTAGEPFRIVDLTNLADLAGSGLPPVPGDTVAERRATLLTPPRPGRGVSDGGGTNPRPGPHDDLRRLLVREPRGHAGMYGGLVVPPDDDGAHLGVLFWHKDGWSTACGHGTIALGAWAVDSGRVAAPADGDAQVRIDVPSGRVTATVHRTAGRTTAVTFRNVPARVSARKVPVATSLGTVEVDLAHAGACYAALPAAALGLTVDPAGLAALTRAGQEIRTALADHPATRDPKDPRLSGVYGVILYEELPDTPRGPHQRNVTVFADGQVDRSPCGSGTSARLALLADEGRLTEDEELTHTSIVGTVFTGRVLPARPGAAGRVTEVTGTAHRTGEHLFVLDPDDTLGTGFAL
ncbi:proline racemase family protein [Streptomyces sp. NPDC051909]|uniref:proline racemase family protein n=1 Tax=Streptomyces sp. NPDC051909 TaxID=3154944 RepID=UPI00343BA18F